MSATRVDIVRIQDIRPHPNADSLEIAYPWGVDGWPVIVRKHLYAVGDLVVYCPVDSILPQNIEEIIFPPDSKIKLHRSRVRAIKIRGHISQGMIICPSDLHKFLTPEDFEEGRNVAEVLGITKYEPPANSVPSLMRIGQPKKVKPDLKAFKKYTDVEHGKYWTRELLRDETVVVTQKLHGTSFRAGWFKSEANTFWQKVRKFFGLMPEWTFAWGSRNVQIQVKPGKKHTGCSIESQGVDFGDVYTKMVEQYDLRSRIPKGMAIYGEIVGDGIQKGYRYGCKEGEHKLYLYDISINNGSTWLDYLPNQTDVAYSTFFNVAQNLELDTVPILYIGAHSPEKIAEFIDVNPLSDEVNEGIVVRPAQERSTPHLGRVVLKFVSDAFYLQKQGTDFH